MQFFDFFASSLSFRVVYYRSNRSRERETQKSIPPHAHHDVLHKNELFVKEADPRGGKRERERDLSEREKKRALHRVWKKGCCCSFSRWSGVAVGIITIIIIIALSKRERGAKAR